MCRNTTGDCDVAEVCNGTSAYCPADGYRALGFVCRSAVSLCDVQEVCNGTSAACPDDVIGPNGTLCRAANASLLCDAPEYCNGTSTTCPTDAPLPQGVVCRASAGNCDLPEQCDGVSLACPTDTFENSTVMCRNATGSVCDLGPEFCTGNSSACPTDTFAPNTTVCRNATAGGCDVEEKCTGTSGVCPADAVQPATFICRPAAGPCDTAETCNGVNITCPADVVQNSSVVCRAATGFCDLPEFCPGGNGTACPGDVLKPNTTECRAANGTNPAQFCKAGVCPLIETTRPVIDVNVTVTGSPGCNQTLFSAIVTEIQNDVRADVTPNDLDGFVVASQVTCTTTTARRMLLAAGEDGSHAGRRLLATTATFVVQIITQNVFGRAQLDLLTDTFDAWVASVNTQGIAATVPSLSNAIVLASGNQSALAGGAAVESDVVVPAETLTVTRVGSDVLVAGASYIIRAQVSRGLIGVQGVPITILGPLDGTSCTPTSPQSTNASGVVDFTCKSPSAGTTELKVSSEPARGLSFTYSLLVYAVDLSITRVGSGDIAQTSSWQFDVGLGFIPATGNAGYPVTLSGAGAVCNASINTNDQGVARVTCQFISAWSVTLTASAFGGLATKQLAVVVLPTVNPDASPSPGPALPSPSPAPPVTYATKCASFSFPFSRCGPRALCGSSRCSCTGAVDSELCACGVTGLASILDPPIQSNGKTVQTSRCKWPLVVPNGGNTLYYSYPGRVRTSFGWARFNKKVQLELTLSQGVYPGKKVIKSRYTPVAVDCPAVTYSNTLATPGGNTGEFYPGPGRVAFKFDFAPNRGMFTWKRNQRCFKVPLAMSDGTSYNVIIKFCKGGCL